MKRFIQLLIAGILFFLSLCSKAPVAVSDNTGDLELWINLLNGMVKTKEKNKTSYDSMVIEISGQDLETIRYVKPINTDIPFVKDTITKIPSGNNRAIKIFTINKSSEIIHKDSAEVRHINIIPNTLNLLNVFLVPVKGSIYIQIGSIPADIDSISATFTDKNGNSWRNVVKREPKVSISIDNLPDKSEGFLMVCAFKAGGDTLYRAQKEIKIDTRKNSTINLSFEQILNGVGILIDIERPSVINAVGSIGKNIVAEKENGEIIITEIMYASDDSEYIEIYNTLNLQKNIDTLYVDIDGEKILFTDINIPPQSFYVLSRQYLPWSDNWATSKNSLNLSSVNGNWITLISKNGEIFDQVIFTTGKNNIEWPNVTGKNSICLKKEFFSSSGNNYGFNWEIAQTFIEDTQLKGTPHH